MTGKEALQPADEIITLGDGRKVWLKAYIKESGHFGPIFGGGRKAARKHPQTVKVDREADFTFSLEDIGALQAILDKSYDLRVELETENEQLRAENQRLCDENNVVRQRTAEVVQYYSALKKNAPNVVDLHPAPRVEQAPGSKPRVRVKALRGPALSSLPGIMIDGRRYVAVFDLLRALCSGNGFTLTSSNLFNYVMKLGRDEPSLGYRRIASGAGRGRSFYHRGIAEDQIPAVTSWFMSQRAIKRRLAGETKAEAA